MKRTLSLLLAMVMAFGVLSAGLSAYAEAGLVADSDARAMLDSINAFRTGSDAWYWNSDDSTKTVLTDLKALTYDENLEAIAKIRAQEIAKDFPNNFKHTRPDGTKYTTCTVTDASGNVVSSKGENIAAGTNYTQDNAFVAWCETDQKYAGQGHRRNMLSSSFTSIGIAGYDAGDGMVYWVQEFGKDSSGGDVTPAPVTPAAPAKPAKTELKKLTPKSKSVVITWKKVTKNATGYQIQLATDKKFKKNKKTVNIGKKGTVKTTVKKLKGKKKYFVRIRVVNKKNGKTAYSKWSKVKTVTPKK